mmetsp:Transcript_28551/g.68662  ORF Transcript_28551/g.68662 Transcript_28551/m.68662 type:complete len:767 (-) Transcript_28551:105-2405(-)
MRFLLLLSLVAAGLRLHSGGRHQECPEGFTKQADGSCTEPPTEAEASKGAEMHEVDPELGGRVYEAFKDPPRIQAVSKANIPMHTPEDAPKVSTTVLCIIVLVTVYFVLFSTLAILRAVNNVTDDACKSAELYVYDACLPCAVAPMVAVLFLAVRMRAILLTQGRTDEWNLPQPYVKQAMVVATFAILAKVVLMGLVLPLIAASRQAEPPRPKGQEDTDDVAEARETTEIENVVLRLVFLVVQYVLMLIQIVAIVLVIYGLYTMDTPALREKVWGGEAPEVSPAVNAIIYIVALYFTVNILHSVLETALVWRDAGIPAAERDMGDPLRRWSSALRIAVASVRLFCPMVCILFIAIRLRAYQLDPLDGSLPEYVNRVFMLCAYLLTAQAALCVLLALVVNRINSGECEGDVAFEMDADATALLVILQLVRVAVLVGVVACIAVVCYAMITLEDASKNKPPLPPALGSVVSLTIQYFLVLCMLQALIVVKILGAPSRTITESSRPGGRLHAAITVLDQTLKTVAFAPMLCILFLAVRMRSLQLTLAADGSIPEGAGPQCWAQEFMHISTWSILLQAGLCICLGILFRRVQVKDGVTSIGVDPVEDEGEEPNEGQEVCALDVNDRWCKAVVVRRYPGEDKTTSTYTVRLREYEGIIVKDEADQKFLWTGVPSRYVWPKGQPPQPPPLNVCLTAWLLSFRGVAMMAMYGGAIAVLWAIFIMRPDNLPPWGAETCLLPVTLSTPVDPLLRAEESRRALQALQLAASHLVAR